MKNIHVLPTPNPSRLRINQKGKLILSTIAIGSKGETQNIYITSNEEIKIGDWCIDEKENIVKADKDFIFNCSHEFYEFWKKIILTTDVDLIKDGVQAITDEFLEWFVKNPSCEEVEVNKLCYGALSGFADAGYKIIIPKEIGFKVDNGKRTETFYQKPKQDSVYKCTCLRPQVNCFSGMCSYCNRQIVKNLTTEDLKQKQETLEEAKKYAELSYYGDEVDAFVRGAKWQAKRMYSEEETIQLLIKFNQEIQEVEDVRIWFEQFKKK